MTNDYLEINMTETDYGSAFYCKADFLLDNMSTYFRDVEVKIDTGCSFSTIPVKRLGIAEKICKQLKISDIENKVDYLRSYGIETGGKIHFVPVTKRQKINSEALKFKHKVLSFRLCGVPIPVNSIYLNYNRSGNILIGMDILQKMICHWDISKKTGKTVMLCCPRERANEAFYKAMREHFGIEKVA